jgi:RNA polymerase sigma-70 factor (ECF subfamily)
MSADFADPDIELMLRFQKGEERCFEELVGKHTRGVLNLVFRYLGDASRAEDVAQDIFVKVYRARMKYEPKAKFSTWLYRIAVNHCLNEIRRRKSQPSLAAPHQRHARGARGENPDARMSRVELQQAVKGGHRRPAREPADGGHPGALRGHELRRDRRDDGDVARKRSNRSCSGPRKI